MKNSLYICAAKYKGTLAQLVEQRTENPCVPGSIPGGTTEKSEHFVRIFCFLEFPPVNFNY